MTVTTRNCYLVNVTSNNYFSQINIPSSCDFLLSQQAVALSLYLS